MEKITVELCMGTTCFVMGGSAVAEFQDLLTEEQLQWVVTKHTSCLGLCKDRKYGKAPYVMVAGEVVAEATAMSVVEKIKEYLK